MAALVAGAALFVTKKNQVQIAARDTNLKKVGNDRLHAHAMLSQHHAASIPCAAALTVSVLVKSEPRHFVHSLPSHSLARPHARPAPETSLDQAMSVSLWFVCKMFTLNVPVRAFTFVDVLDLYAA